MDKNINNKYDVNENNPDGISRVRELLKKNRAAALGLAVFLAVSTSMAGCASRDEEDDEDDSYYISGGYSGGGGSYYYYKGGSYKSSSWGKSYGYSGSAKSSYSSGRAGSIGS